LGSPA